MESVPREVLCPKNHVLQVAAGFDADRDHRPSPIPPAPALCPESVRVEMASIADSEGAQQFSTLAIGAGQFGGGGRRPVGQRAGVAVGRSDGKHVGHGIEVAPMMKSALIQFEPLFIGGEAHAGCDPRRQSQDGDPGHPLLAGHRFPGFRGPAVVIDDDPVRPRLGIHRLGVHHVGVDSGGSWTHTGRRQPRPPALAVQFRVQRVLEFGG